MYLAIHHKESIHMLQVLKAIKENYDTGGCDNRGKKIRLSLVLGIMERLYTSASSNMCKDMRIGLSSEVGQSVK